MNYRGLTNKEYQNVIIDCVDKTEGRNNLTWEEIVDKHNLEINPNTLRVAFCNPFGTYSFYKFYEEVTPGGINEIKEEVGYKEISKIEIKEEQKKLRQLNNRLSKSVIIAKDIKYYLNQDLKLIKEIPRKKLPNKKGYSLIVGVSDWHIGYTIKNYKGNVYNYKIARNKLGEFLTHIKRMCDMYSITEVIVVQLGDIIENTYMRETTQAFECEFSMSEQISKAIKLFYEFITSISEFANVRVISLGGNHSRMSNKNANIEGDNCNVILVETIKMLVETSKNERISIDDIDYIADSHKFKVNGLVLKANHGDKLPKETKKAYDTEVSLEGEKIDIILRGHYHNFSVESQNNGAYVITVGSLFGYNPYSVNTVRSNSPSSQLLIVLGDKEIELIKDVKL